MANSCENCNKYSDSVKLEISGLAGNCKFLKKACVLCTSSALRSKEVLHFLEHLSFPGGTRWRSWLRHCATSRKVAGSIPDYIIGIFHRHNPSGRTMALGSTQSLT